MEKLSEENPNSSNPRIWKPDNIETKLCALITGVPGRDESERRVEFVVFRLSRWGFSNLVHGHFKQNPRPGCRKLPLEDICVLPEEFKPAWKVKRQGQEYPHCWYELQVQNIELAREVFEFLEELVKEVGAEFESLREMYLEPKESLEDVVF